MASGLVGFSVKTTSFLDRPKAQKALGRFERLWLMRIGSFTRTAARQSIRTRKRISTPGDPPTNRTGLLKNSILFGMSAGGQSVVIGPNAASFRGSRNQGASVLEHGGTSRTQKYKRVITGGRWVTRNGKRFQIGGTRRRVKDGVESKTYRARPYMAPALVKMAVDLRKKYPTELPKMFNIATAGI